MSNWKPIEGGYYVSRFGDVYSSKRGRELNPVKFGRYRRVELRIGGRRVCRLVHNLVAEAFIGPRPDGLQVCHNNGNGADNRVENLRYGTAKSNRDDRRKHGKHGNKLTEDQVRSILQDPRPQSVIAAEYGINQSNVSRIKNGKTWTI